MVNVFGDTSGQRNLQMVKKVVVTKGKFNDYMDEIRQSYELGFPTYRLHTNAEGTFVTPIRVYSGGYSYWTMLPQWRLVEGRLKRMK